MSHDAIVNSAEVETTRSVGTVIIGQVRHSMAELSPVSRQFRMGTEDFSKPVGSRE